MIIDNKEAIFNGGPFQSYWWADEHEPVHPTIKAELNHTIDCAALERAWENTKRVYPLIDLIPDDYDEEVIFFKSDGDSRPIKSRNTLKIVSEASLYRGVSLTYYGSTITLSLYHSIADEQGLNEIFKTLMYYYLCAYTNTSDDTPVMTKENRVPEEYYIQNTMLNCSDYKPQPVKLYKDIRHIFNDMSVVNDENCAITIGEMEISFKEYDELCKNTGSSPDELFTYVMAKTIYNMYPDEKNKLSFGLMTDFRETFNVSDTIAPCSKKMPLVLTYDDVMNCTMNTAIRKITDTRQYQKSADYIKSHVALENTYSVLNIRNACLSINFSGAFDIGEKNSYIRNISMHDYSIRSVFMMLLNDTIKVSFQYGTATDKYMNAVKDTLNGLGIKADITAKAYPVSAETEKPIV